MAAEPFVAGDRPALDAVGALAQWFGDGLDRADVGRGTYDRALESMNGVCEEIESLLTKSWGRT